MAEPIDGPRRPGLIPDDDAFLPVPAPVDVSGGVDSNADGRPDTLVTDDGFDLVVHTDRDGDGLADHVLRIGADGGVREVAPPSHGVVEGVLHASDAELDP